MIPILYETTETAFTGGGICRLGEITYCEVTEERNGIYECEFQYPVFGKYYADILEGRYIACTHDDKQDIQPFRIYSRSAPLHGLVTFYAHHISYKLSDIVLQPFTSNSPAGVFNLIPNKSINTNPFTFWTSKSGSSTFKMDEPQTVRSILGGTQGSVLDVFGGEYEFDKLTVKLHGERGSDSGVTIRYAKNLTGIEQNYDISGLYNAVVPFWKGSVEGTDTSVYLDSWLVYQEDTGAVKAKAVDFSDRFESVPTQEQLQAAAESYLSSNRPWIPKENIKVNFVQMWQTDEYASVASLQRVGLCDTVNVYYPELGVEATGIKVIKTVYNVLLDRYDEIELGTTRTNFVENIRIQQEEKIQQIVSGFEAILRAEIEHATELLTNPGDSYVVFKGLDENNNVVYGNGTVPNPQEILIMNTTDPSTATQVLRINKNGIGFATNINGPYRTAWTLDGHFIADFITSGTINGNLIRTGILSDYGTITWQLTSDNSIIPGKGYYTRSGTSPNYIYSLVDSPVAADLSTYYEAVTTHHNYWNLETGEFQLQWNSTITDGTRTLTLGEYLDELGSYSSGQYLKSVETQYAKGSSNTTAPTSGWATTVSGSGTYLWMRTYKTFYGGLESEYSTPVCLGNASTISSVETQYYLSTSSSTPTDGSWSTTSPTYNEGRYIWTRQKITWTDTSVTYTDAVLASNLTTNAGQVTEDQLTQEKIFNLLTNNGALAGIYMQNGQLYINGTYIKSGSILANLIKLFGNMTVYQGENSNVSGGYLGYTTGLVGFGNTTAGMHIADSTNHSEFVATNAGARMQSGNQQFYLTYDTVDGETSGIAGLSINGNLILDIGGTLKLLDGNTEKTGANNTYTFGNGSLQVYRGIVVAGSGAYGVTGTEVQIGNANITISNGMVTAITPWNASSYASDINGLANGKVSKSGDTMTGFLVLHANPTSNMHAATKQYVDTAVSNASGGGGSTVTITPATLSGSTVKIADYSINGSSGSLYAPTGGSGGTATAVFG